MKEPPDSHWYFGFSQGRALSCLMSTSRGWPKQVWWVTSTYKPAVPPRLSKLSSQLCSWLSAWAKETGLSSGHSCSPTSFISMGLSKTSIPWSTKTFFASLHPWSYSWHENFWQTVAGFQVFQLVSYCTTRSCFYLLKMASLRTSYYSGSKQSSYAVPTTYHPTSKTTVVEWPCPDCAKHK